MTKERIVRRYVAAFNCGDWDALAALFTPDAEIFGVLGAGGLDVAMPIWRMLHEGLAMELHIQAMVSEGDTVAVRYIERGRFVGPFRGHQPTGQGYEINAMEWFVFRDGLIARRWGARDSAAIARQTGMPPG